MLPLYRATPRRWLFASLVLLASTTLTLAQKPLINGLTSRVLLDAEGAWLFLTIDAYGGTRPILLTATGPGLATYGVSGYVSDPQLEVWDQAGVRIAANDDRPDGLFSPDYPSYARAPKDSGLQLTLASGVYAVRVSGVGGATGVCLIDAKDLGPRSGLISIALRARLENSGETVVGTSLDGEGTISLGAYLTGPNLPLLNPLADPRLIIKSGATTISTLDTYNSSTAGAANAYRSPMTGNAKNAGFGVFAWSTGAGTSATLPPTFYVSNQAGPAGGAFLFEIHDHDSPTFRQPVIYVPPQSATVVAGATLSLSILTGGQFIPTIQWQRDGLDIPFATGTTYVRPNIAPADAGSYRVRVTSSVGTTTSPPATVAVTFVAPTISNQPTATTAAIGQVATFSVIAAGGNLTYQWRKNGVNIPGATAPTLTLSAVTEADAGTYIALITNTSGTLLSSPATLTITNPNPGRLINLSVRAFAGTGERTLIVGFALSGRGSKPLVLRGVGPGLAAFGVPGALLDPLLAVFVGATQIMSNDNWSGSDGRALGAFPLALGSKDAVVSNNFDTRSFTAQVTGTSTGESLVEIYDGAVTDATLRLTNLSARTQLDSGQRLIVGLTIAGSTPRSLIVRAVGPGLAAFGLSTAHPDPRLELYSGDTKIADNDQWIGDDGRGVGAFPLAAGSKDAVIVRALAPGGYTVHVLGADITGGVVLVEVYEGL